MSIRPRTPDRANAVAWLPLALLIALALALPQPAQAQLAVGAVAPDFTLLDTTNVSHSLVGDYAGQVVVLFFVGYG